MSFSYVVLSFAHMQIFTSLKTAAWHHLLCKTFVCAASSPPMAIFVHQLYIPLQYSEETHLHCQSTHATPPSPVPLLLSFHFSSGCWLGEHIFMLRGYIATFWLGMHLTSPAYVIACREDYFKIWFVCTVFFFFILSGGRKHLFFKNTLFFKKCLSVLSEKKMKSAYIEAYIIVL